MELIERKLIPVLEEKQTIMPIVPEGARKSTINLQAIHRGQPESYEGMPSPCVPDSCRLVLDRRFLIEESLDEVKAEVEDPLEELVRTRMGFSYCIRDIMEFHPTMTEDNPPVVHAAEQAIRWVLKQNPEKIISPGTYDQKHIKRIGHLHDCIAYGPGILYLAHQPNEYVIIEDIVKSSQVITLATTELLVADA